VLFWHGMQVRALEGLGCRGMATLIVKLVVAAMHGLHARCAAAL
jgi:hypothetical protein